MNKAVILPLVMWLAFLSHSCQSEGEVAEIPPSVASLSVTIDSIALLLIFQKEQKASAWSRSDSGYVLQKDFPLAISPNILPGFYLTNTSSIDQGILQLDAQAGTPGLERVGDEPQINGSDVKNLASHIPLKKTIDIVVYPNDPGKKGRLEPRFGAPHWLAERYGKLMIHLEEFRTRPLK